MAAPLKSPAPLPDTRLAAKVQLVMVASRLLSEKDGARVLAAGVAEKVVPVRVRGAASW